MYKVNRYPDGGCYIVTDKYMHESITYRINSYEDLFLLKSLQDATNGKIKEILIPCMFQQQHDRRFNEYESFELKLVADFINSMRFEKVNIYHPHSDVTTALINNAVALNPGRFLDEVLDREGIKTSDLVILTTDAGGYKSLYKLLDSLAYHHLAVKAILSCSKSRTHIDGKSELVTILPNYDFTNETVLVVDDICVAGGTFINIAELLRDKGLE